MPSRGYLGIQILYSNGRYRDGSRNTTDIPNYLKMEVKVHFEFLPEPCRGWVMVDKPQIGDKGQRWTGTWPPHHHLCAQWRHLWGPPCVGTQQRTTPFLKYVPSVQWKLHYFILLTLEESFKNDSLVLKTYYFRFNNSFCFTPVSFSLLNSQGKNVSILILKAHTIWSHLYDIISLNMIWTTHPSISLYVNCQERLFLDCIGFLFFGFIF